MEWFAAANRGTKVAARGLHTQAGKLRRKALGRARRGEKSRPKWRGINLVQKMFGLCKASTGTKIDESMQARGMDTKEYGKMSRRILRRRAQRRWQSLWEYQAMHEEHSLSSWLREEVEGKAEGRKKLDKEGQEEDSNSGERDVKAQSKTVETSSKRICPNRLSCPALCEKCFEVFSDSEVERVGKSGDFSVCVLAVPSVVSAVTVPLSDENVVCEVVSSDSNCECVEPRCECGFGVYDRNEY